MNTGKPKCPGFLMVVSGPSGCGKSTLCQQLLLHRDLGFGLVVSHTSRSRRGSEKDGCEYIFLSQKQFEENIAKDFYLEWARVHGNYYGSPRIQVQELLDQGRNVLLEIDVQGGLQVKNSIADAVLVFVCPPNFKVLERRLRGRATDTDEVIEMRIRNAVSELESIKTYDYLVLNDQLDQAVNTLRAIVVSEENKVSRLCIEDLYDTLCVPSFGDRKGLK